MHEVGLAPPKALVWATWCIWTRTRPTCRPAVATVFIEHLELGFVAEWVTAPTGFLDDSQRCRATRWTWWEMQWSRPA